MDCLNIKLTDETTDNSLRRLDEFGIGLRGNGSGAGLMQISWYIPSNTIRLAYGNGGFYSDAAGTNYLGTELIGTGNSTVFVKIDSGKEDILYFKGLSRLSRFSIVAPQDTANSPTVKLDLQNLNYLNKLTELDCGSGLASDNSFVGYIENLTNPALQIVKLSYSNCEGNLGRVKLPSVQTLSFVNSRIYGDLNNILANNPNLKSLIYSCLTTTGTMSLNTTLDIKNVAGIETYDDRTAKNEVFYTGGRTLNFKGLKMLSVGVQTQLATTELDDLLISLSVSDLVSGCIIKLSGVRSSASDAAMTALSNKGATVTITIP